MKKVLAAQAASNDLHPFYFDVGLDCEDPKRHDGGAIQLKRLQKMSPHELLDASSFL
jgi:hypothetical protein